MSDNIADKKDHFRTLAARSIPWFGIFPKQFILSLTNSEKMELRETPRIGS
jgi:hypothetical protein